MMPGRSLFSNISGTSCAPVAITTRLARRVTRQSPAKMLSNLSWYSPNTVASLITSMESDSATDCAMARAISTPVLP